MRLRRYLSLIPLALVLGCPEIVVPSEQDVGSDQAPVFESISEKTLVEGVAFQLELSATDPEGGAVTYSLANKPTGATLTGSVFSWTPGNDISEPGADARLTLTFKAEDAGGASGTLDVDLIVLNNSDSDSEPDATDLDDDNDGIPDVEETATSPFKADTDDDGAGDKTDNCPTDKNVDQLDTDGDKVGDACDTDDDGDGELDKTDNCPTVKNPQQTDLDDDKLGDECDSDRDGDGVDNAADNCPDTPNPLVDGAQPDTNQDGEGNACDPDDDGDGKLDAADNCPLVFNPEQGDNDDDKLGDVCDPDDDNDGVADTADNCPLVFQTTQSDKDQDGLGDVCDVCVEDGSNVDDDADGVCDSVDNCLGLKDPDQTDTDDDGKGDACDDDDDDDGDLDVDDNCPLVSNPLQEDCNNDQIGDACQADDDGDTVLDVDDNCPCTPNLDQADCDGDELGDACDPDSDGDGMSNALDNCPDCTPNPLQENHDNDTLGDACDDDDDNDLIPDADDNCPLAPNNDQAAHDDDGLGDACDDDDDGDGFADVTDVCPTVYDVDQLDLDGDMVGDVCDDDDDDDGVGDVVDTCPRLFSPNQSDLDADGVGDVCDDDIVLPADVPTNSIGGAAYGGITALVLADSSGCTECLDASALVVDQGDYSAFEAGFGPSAARVAAPAIAADRAAHVSAMNAGGAVVARRVVDGVYTAAFGPATLTGSLPRWLTVGDAFFSVVTEGAVEKLYGLEAGKSAILTKSATTFTDLRGTGLVRGADGSAYLPYQAGGKYGVLALSAETGKAGDPLTTPPPLGPLSGLTFLTVDSATGNPWWCQRRAGNPEVVRLDRLALGPSAPLSGASVCTDLEARSTPDGRLWVRIQGATPALATFAQGGSVTSRAGCAPELYVAGSAMVAVGDCGAESIELVDPDGVPTVATWSVNSIAAYGRVVATNDAASAVAVAWRTNKSGASAVQAALRGVPNAELVLTAQDSTNKPVIQNLWATRTGAVLSHLLVTVGLSPSQVQQTVLTLAGPSAGLELAVTKGFASVMETASQTYVAHNGTGGAGAGLYRLVGSQLVFEMAGQVDGLTNRPVLVGVSAGRAVFAMRGTGAAWRLVAVDEAGGGAAVVMDDLLGPPSETYSAGKGRYYLRVDGADGVALVQVAQGNVTTLVSAQTDARFESSADGLSTWGYRHHAAGPWSLCRLSPAACTVLPTAAPLPFSAVDDGGLFHAAWVCDNDTCGADPASPRIHLYRSFNLAP